ncbi:hypothetical protein N665_0543s0019 [Sinapis alba]|nr:hypothetical protein N665_0543s0019 [Sinapis alba]
MFSGVISNTDDALKPTVFIEGSGKQVMEEPRSVSERRFVTEIGPESGSVTNHNLPRQTPENNEGSLSRRLEIPLFDGDEAESWVLRVEQYFEIGDFTEEEKLRAVRLCFIGDALPWYWWERSQNPFLSWEQMKIRVLDQFSVVRDTSA